MDSRRFTQIVFISCVLWYRRGYGNVCGRRIKERRGCLGTGNEGCPLTGSGGSGPLYKVDTGWTGVCRNGEDNLNDLINRRSGVKFKRLSFLTL